MQKGTISYVHKFVIAKSFTFYRPWHKVENYFTLESVIIVGIIT